VFDTFCGAEGAAGRGLLMVSGAESSEEEESTLLRAGRDVVDCATMGEKLPGARG